MSVFLLLDSAGGKFPYSTESAEQRILLAHLQVKCLIKMKRMQRLYSRNKYSMERTSHEFAANGVQQAKIELATYTSLPITVSDTVLGRHRQIKKGF